MVTQAEMDGEIAGISAAYESARHEGGAEETQPRLDYPPYRSSLLRHPTKDLHHADPEGVELWAPAFGHRDVGALEADLTIQHGGEPIGERMVVTGRVLDGDGRPVRRQLVEIWQANAGGRYIHKRDQHPAAIDPNFTGVGRCLTDDDGTYRFTTIKPGPYPWKNHRNAWRPAHIHFSMFGTEFTQRMVTQMYFPGDPLFALDPIYQSIVDPQGARAARRDVRPRRHPARVVHRLPLGHRAHRHPPHPDGDRGGARMSRAPGDLTPTAGQTVGPFFHYALPYPGDSELVPPGRADAIRLHGVVRDGAGDPVPDALLEIWQADAVGSDRAASPAPCAATASPSPAGAGRRPTRRATTPSRPSLPARRARGRRPSWR